MARHECEQQSLLLPCLFFSVLAFPLGADDERAEFFLSIAGGSSMGDDAAIVDGSSAGRSGGDSKRSGDSYLGLHGRNNSEELHIDTPENKTCLLWEDQW